MSVVAGLTSPGDITEAPKKALSTVKNEPWLAVGIVALVLIGVVLLEAYKPGALTGPIRRGLTKLGLIKEGA